MPLITLVIADDHPIFLHGIRSLIGMDPELTILAECSRGDDALKLIRTLKPTVAVLDLAMPGLDGLSVAAALRQEDNKTPLIILTSHDDPILVERARNCRVNACLFKHHAIADLLETIRNVADNQNTLTPPCDAHLMKPVTLLTEREQEVLRLVACGQNNRFIGETLGITRKTADNHRTNLMKKLGIHSTADLVRYAVKLGLV
ncbi:MAG: response regulator transcription factor [Geobacteraceae bacterium]|nr:response regulator transcription factor [Geobacteraceae bacterium]